MWWYYHHGGQNNILCFKLAIHVVHEADLRCKNLNEFWCHRSIPCTVHQCTACVHRSSDKKPCTVLPYALCKCKCNVCSMYAMKVLYEQIEVPCRYLDMQVCRYVSTFVCMNGSRCIVQNVSINARDTHKHNVHDMLLIFMLVLPARLGPGKPMTHSNGQKPGTHTGSKVLTCKSPATNKNLQAGKCDTMNYM